MYLPTQFTENRVDVLHALMRARPLCTLVTAAESGLVADHLPVQTRNEPAPLGSICGHIARANPLWREYRSGTQSLAIFQGPHVYISPSFYPSKVKTGEVVPTWDYAVVHASGTLRFIEDLEWLRSLVAGLTRTHEMSRAEPWEIDDAPAAYIDKMLKLIVGFEFSIVSLSGKWKVSQNRTHEDRQGVIRNLQDAADPDSRQIADMLASLHSADVPVAQ
ncbi:MAG: FMN-binding negative transcriptional regulator [Pseudomonadota bacterium]|nr:FMN-binding negative transcriptional regulator [Pseudomonadota bacterium]